MLTFCHHSICALKFTCPLYFFLRGYGGQIHATCCTCHSLAGRKHSRFVCTECCALVDTGSLVTTMHSLAFAIAMELLGTEKGATGKAGTGNGMGAGTGIRMGMDREWERHERGMHNTIPN